MQVVVVTGHSSSNIETIWDLVRSLNVAGAAPGQNDTEDPAVFHHKLFLARKVRPADEPGQIKPGRMWQRLAENLLVNNVESDVWGWGDVQSSRLLDFWASIDHCTHFVLLYVAPEVNLAMSLAATPGADEDPRDRLTSWHLKNSELLDFYSRNRDRSLLINTYSLIRTPHRLGELLADRFGIELPDADEKNIPCIDFPVGGMRAFLARALLENSDAIALYEELETASDLPADPDYYRHEVARAWSENARLIESQAELQVAQSEAGQTKQALKEAKRRLDETHSQLRAAQTSMRAGEQAQSQLRAQIGELQKNLAKARQAGEEQIKENELLLLQLHQVQEELENYYLRVQETDDKLRQQAQELKTAQDRTKDQEKKVGETQQALEKTQHELDETHSQLKAAQTSMRAGEQAQSQLRAQIGELQKDLAKARQTGEEQIKENELLLLQLHQVQEELENYYLKYKETQATLRETPLATAPTPQKATKKNGHDTLADEKGFVRAYLNKRTTAKKLRRKISLIRRSHLFDEHWYLKEYPDVAQSGMDPVRHYLKFGAAEGRDPSMDFDTRYYQYSNPDVSDAAVNPLIHYISHGKEEGRRALP